MAKIVMYFIQSLTFMYSMKNTKWAKFQINSRATNFISARKHFLLFLNWIANLHRDGFHLLQKVSRNIVESWDFNFAGVPLNTKKKFPHFYCLEIFTDIFIFLCFCAWIQFSKIRILWFVSAMTIFVWLSNVFQD